MEEKAGIPSFFHFLAINQVFVGAPFSCEIDGQACFVNRALYTNLVMIKLPANLVDLQLKHGPVSHIIYAALLRRSADMQSGTL
jgi:hypothetical protein